MLRRRIHGARHFESVRPFPRSRTVTLRHAGEPRQVNQPSYLDSIHCRGDSEDLLIPSFGLIRVLPMLKTLLTMFHLLVQKAADVIIAANPRTRSEAPTDEL